MTCDALLKKYTSKNKLVWRFRRELNYLHEYGPISLSYLIILYHELYLHNSCTPYNLLKSTGTKCKKNVPIFSTESDQSYHIYEITQGKEIIIHLYFYSEKYCSLKALLINSNSSSSCRLLWIYCDKYSEA